MAAEIVMVVGGELAAVTGRQFMYYTRRQFTYIFKYKSYIETLEKEVKKLKDARDRMLDAVHDAEKEEKELYQSVIRWLKDVESTILQAETLSTEKQENDRRCFNQLRFNLKTRYKRGRKACKITMVVMELMRNEGRISEGFGNRNNPHETRLALNKDYLAFESRNSTTKNVWVALNDAKIDMIGVHGMRGLGKTMLVQEVGRQAMKHKLFDEMVFIEVTDTPDVNKIQTKIAEELGLQFGKENERASKLYERLKNSKKILLILDNICKDLDLKTIGIPSGSDHGGCKLLLTTRKADVLATMDSTNIFGMGFLTEEEARRLFKQIAGYVTRKPELKTLQHDVLKECGGLPLAIATIANDLKGQTDQSEWEDALQNLRTLPRRF